MGEPAFVNGDTRDTKPFHQFEAKFAADLIMITTQSHFLMGKIIIGVTSADGAHRSLDLRNYKRLVVIDII